MIFILAPDSFKESMSAKEACVAMEMGIKEVLPTATCVHVPLADGGEGTMQALADATGGTIYKQLVKGPLGDTVTGEYAVLGDGETGVVELASASGLHLVPKEKRNPLFTSTYGTGELIKAVLEKGVNKIIIAIGGSATIDGGAGMMQALGVKFLDATGDEIKPGGGALHQISRIDISQLITNKYAIKIEVACDVTNPLTGAQGASAVYGPQKGATPEMIRVLDDSLEHYARQIKADLGEDIRAVPGGGAAGGAGAGLMAFLNAELVPGIDLVLRTTNFEKKLLGANYVFTGEGSLDYQTTNGKTISGVVGLAKRHNKPVIAFAGKVADADILYQMGITAAFGILPAVSSLEEALENGKRNLTQTVKAVSQLIKLKVQE